MDSLPFDAEGFTLERCDDMDYFLSRMKETVLQSVDESERMFSSLWLPEMSCIIRNNVLNDSYGDRFILKEGYEYAGALWIGRSRDQFTCEDIGYLLGIYIEEGYRRKGLGTKMVKAAEEWCRINGLVHMSLNVSSMNETAMALYNKCGYSPQSTVMRRLLRP